MFKLELKPGRMTLRQLRRVAQEPVRLRLAPGCRRRIEQSVATVREVIGRGRVIYGVNTGFGLLANTVIPNRELEQLQRSIVLSHAAGTGALMAEATVRLL
ncbi:MAG TPA: aromatic amino acid lyase, partial [Geopsychrobacteraceae bacterium]